MAVKAKAKETAPLMQKITHDQTVSRYAREREAMNVVIIRKQDERKPSEEAKYPRPETRKMEKTQPTRELMPKVAKTPKQVLYPAADGSAIAIQHPPMPVAQDASAIRDPDGLALSNAIGERSMWPVYSYIIEPLMGKEVPQLERILSGRAPSSGAGSCEAALESAILRKERCEIKIEQNAALFESVASDLRNDAAPQNAFARLPEQNRARYLALLKRKLAVKAIIGMLLRDISFLKGMHKRLVLFTADDLLNLIKDMKSKDKKK